jgi:hypothetical protein
MDQVTQQNAALVEETSAASEALQEQAAKLAQAVAVFRLDAAAATYAPVAARPAPAKPTAPAKSAAPRTRIAPATAVTSDWETF